MDIYIDESGSFVCTENPDAWSVVVAYVSYSSQRKKLFRILAGLKIKCGKKVRDEVKLRDINEINLKWFLNELSMLNGIMFCVATDASLIDNEVIIEHRRIQAEKIIEHVDKMHHETMKDSIRNLSESIVGLSPQLYLQLVSQFTLINDVINRSSLYYSQKKPAALGGFKWLIDQKNTTKIIFEEAFEKMAPAIMQSIALREPFISLKEGDYSFMETFIYGENKAPDYLEKVYGQKKIKGDAFNIGKILQDDMSFVDSKSNLGVQIADILASTSRRILRNDFEDNITISKLLGSLMLSSVKGKNTIQLISFVEKDIANEETSRNINLMDAASKPIL
jgi:hypothetical protein